MLRNYTDSDYKDLKNLYMHHEWFGGHFSECRDSRERVAKLIARDPEAIIVYEKGGELAGTVSLFEDGRAAMIYRFVVKENDAAIAKQLYNRAVELLKTRGHDEVLVYAPVGDEQFRARYMDDLGMEKGNDYTCYFAAL